jgi:hypothetical protein
LAAPARRLRQANDGLERQLDREVEVRRNERLAPIDDRAPVRLEGVGCVVEIEPEHHRDEGIGRAIEKPFRQRIINRAAAADEATAEHAVPALVEFLPVPNRVATIVRPVGHENDHRVAPHGIQSANDCAAKSVSAAVLQGPQFGQPPLQVEQDRPGAIGAAVIHDEDLVRDRAPVQFGAELLHRAGDAALLVARRDDDGKQAQGNGPGEVGRIVHGKGDALSTDFRGPRAKSSLAK